MSVCRFTQAPEQAVCPLAQVVEQAPFEQTWVPVHALPQPPQFAESEVVSMQAVLPAHWMRPEVQAHLLLWQVSSLGQAFPQPPQLVLSAVGSTQVPLHESGVPDGQPEVPAAPPDVPAVPEVPEVPAAPLTEVPPTPLSEVPPEPLTVVPPVPAGVTPEPLPPPAPLVPPDENDPHERTRAPSDTTTDTGTKERMVFMRHLQSGRSLDRAQGRAGW